MKKISALLMIAVFVSFSLTAATKKSSSKKNSAKEELPVIKIVSKNGSTDFVTKPVAHSVKEHEKTWYGNQYQSFPDPWYEDCEITVINEKGIELLGNVTGKVKVRGNWTTSYDKKGLRIKFDKKQGMLGLHDGNEFKNWVLLACFKDASMIRDLTALNMSRAMFPEYYASDCRLVEVYINDTYWGVYLLAEQQEVNKNRINITEPEKNYTGTDIGYFFEFDMYAFTEAEEERFYIDYLGDIYDIDSRLISDALINSYTIKSDVYSTAQRDFIQDYMNKLWKICREAAYNKKYYRFKSDYTLEQYTPEGNNDDEKCRNCIENIIDTDSLAAAYIIAEITCDPDLAVTSFLMDIDFGEKGNKKLRFEAPWDFDSTMGNRPACADSQGLFAGKIRDEEFVRGKGNPWMLIFIQTDWFKTLVKEKWNQVNDNGKSTAMSVIDSVAVYKTQFDKNRKKWGNPTNHSGASSELCKGSRTAAISSQQASADYLKNWLEKRFAELDKIFTSW